MLPENDCQILRLTPNFYNDYPSSQYPELLKKQQRAYNCLLFQTHYGFFICVPYRSEIAHKNAFHFTQTIRSKKHKSGLDYTKIIIISKLEYLDNKDAIIDNDEFKETIRHYDQIKKEALSYVENYMEHISGKKVIDKNDFSKKYKYSTLRYFHKELGI